MSTRTILKMDAGMYRVGINLYTLISHKNTLFILNSICILAGGLLGKPYITRGSLS